MIPKYLYKLRPVGNPITLKKEPLDRTQFGNFHVEFYQSGTAALAAAIIAIKKLKSKSHRTPEVILPAYACPDLISAALYAGVKPVLVDLEQNTCWMDLSLVKQRITENTIAVIAVKFLGISERMSKLREICDEYALSLIEDSAQGFPISNPDSYWQGDLNILSFGRGKPINLLGGGAVLTRNEEIQDYLINPTEIFNTLSGTAKYLSKTLLYNALIKPVFYGLALKLPGMNIGETTYKELSHISAMPRDIKDLLNTNISAYKTYLNKSVDIQSLIRILNSSKLSDLVMTSHHDLEYPLLRYPLLIANKQLRDELHAALMPLGASVMYKKPLIHIKNLPTSFKDENTRYSNAENFADRLITFPTHSGISTEILEQIRARITAILI